MGAADAYILSKVFKWLAMILQWTFNVLKDNSIWLLPSLLLALSGWLVLGRVTAKRHRHRQKEQSEWLLEELKKLLKKGLVVKALAKFNVAQRFSSEIACLLPQSLQQRLEEERERHHLDPELWVLLTRKRSETECNGMIEPGKINEHCSDNSLESLGLDLPCPAWQLLEAHANEPEFMVRWQAFIRACSLLVSDLPKEAQEWIAIADDYQIGRITLREFRAAGTRAWDFYNARKATAPPSDLSGLTVVRYCFDLPDWDWDLCAESFFEDLEAAGIPKSRWWPLLQTCYPAILSGVKQS